jgi:hypothetical protein
VVELNGDCPPIGPEDTARARIAIVRIQGSWDCEDGDRILQDEGLRRPTPAEFCGLLEVVPPAVRERLIIGLVQIEGTRGTYIRVSTPLGTVPGATDRLTALVRSVGAIHSGAYLPSCWLVGTSDKLH